MKQYAFYGTAAYDLVFYLSLLLRQMGQRVCIYDQTGEAYLCQGVFSWQEGRRQGIYDGIEITSLGEDGAMVEKGGQEREDVDYLFFLADMPGRPCFTGLAAFLVAGNLPEELKEAGEWVEQCGEDGVVVLRDCIHGVVDAEIFEKLYLPEWFPRENLCGISFDWLDYQERIKRCYGLTRSIPDLSREYEQALLGIARRLTGWEEAELKRIYKKGRKKRK